MPKLRPGDDEVEPDADTQDGEEEQDEQGEDEQEAPPATTQDEPPPEGAGP